SNTTAFKQLVFEKTGLSSGEHTIKVQVSGSKNTAATSIYFVLDYLQVL
ncbi:hypothetical protein H9661_02350, partial [Clostridium sp. Sa3CVN1]|nr:hypothetical protein [Clostridium cibarium]